MPDVQYGTLHYIISMTAQQSNTLPGQQGESNISVQITGPRQQSPKDWRTAIKSGSFKTSLVKFLLQEWAQEAYLPILNGHTIYITSHDKCFEFNATREGVIRQEIKELE